MFIASIIPPKNLRILVLSTLDSEAASVLAFLLQSKEMTDEARMAAFTACERFLKLLKHAAFKERQKGRSTSFTC